MGELTALFKPPYWWPKNIILEHYSPSDLSRQNFILALWQLAQYAELSENVSPLAENFNLNITGRLRVYMHIKLRHFTSTNLHVRRI